MTNVLLVMQRELEVHRLQAERVQKELLALKKENSKLVAAVSKFDHHLSFSFAFFGSF